MVYLQMALSMLAGLVVCVPLVIELVTTVRDYVRAKNWAPLMRIVAELMADAEKLYTDGASRKEYVMSQAKTAAQLVNYEWNDDVEAKISVMIDALCDMAKVVNGEVHHG